MRDRGIDQSEIDDLLADAEAMVVDPHQVQAEAWLGGPQATRSGGYNGAPAPVPTRGLLPPPIAPGARVPADPVIDDDVQFMSADDGLVTKKDQQIQQLSRQSVLLCRVGLMALAAKFLRFNVRSPRFSETSPRSTCEVDNFVRTMVQTLRRRSVC